MPPRNRILVEKKDYIKLNQCHLETEYQLKMQEIKSMPLGNWIVVEKEPTRNYRWREWVPLLWLLVRSKENRETWPWREREPTRAAMPRDGNGYPWPVYLRVKTLLGYGFGGFCPPRVRYWVITSPIGWSGYGCVLVYPKPVPDGSPVWVWHIGPSSH